MNLNYLLLLITLCGSVWLPAADGTLNTAFFNAAGNLTPPNGGGTTPGIWYVPNSGNYTGNMQAFSVVMQKGKILVGGYIRVSSSITPCILRLFADGTVDTTFGTSSGFTFLNSAFFGQTGTFINIGAGVANAVLGLAVDANNKILVGCRLVFTANPQRFAVVRLLENGGRDITFNPGPSFDTNYGGSTPGLWYITAANPIFTSGNSACSALMVQSDGKIVMAGFVGLAGVATIIIGRLNSDGTLDTAGFNAAGTVPGLWYKADAATTPVDVQVAYFNSNTDCISPKSIAIQSTGRILVGGRLHSTTPNLVRAGIIALTSAGIIDTTFNPTPSASSTMGGDIPGYFVFLTGSGSFSTGAVNGLAIDSAQNILVIGSTLFSGTTSVFVMRLTPNGVIDPTFGGQASPYGATAGLWIVTSSSVLNSTGIGCTVALDSFNRIVVAFTGRIASTASQKIAAARLTTDGILDTTFNPSPGTGNPYGGVAPGLWYFSTDNTGTFDGTNHTNSDMAVSNNGQIFLACYPTIAGPVQRFACVSLINKCGILQDIASPFNTGVNGLILTTTIDQAGRLLAGGYYSSNAQLTRYNPTGTVRDSAFSGDGVALGDLATTATINKVVNSGTGYLVAGVSNTSQFTTALYDSSGLLDTAYNPAGAIPGVVSESTVGVSQAYDLLINGTALTVAGFTSTNQPSVINYEAATGARNNALGQNGWQQFGYIGTGALYGVQFTTGLIKYGAGQGSNTAFVRSLGNPVGLLQDTAAPFNTGANGLLYTTTITQAGNLLVGGQYGTTWEVVSYTPAAARDGSFGTNGIAAAPSGFNAGRVRAVALDSVGRIIATGATINASPEMFTTVRYNSAGTSSTTGRETTFGVGSGMGIYVNEDDTFEVVGFTTTGTSETPTIMSYDENVNLLNVDQFTTLVPGQFYAIQEADGNFFAAGSSVDTAILYPLLDGTGLLRDTEPPFNTGYNGRMYGGIMDSNFSIVLCGTYNNIFTVVRYTSVGERDPFTVGVNGVLQEPSLNAATGYAITQDSAGSYYVAAESTVDGNLVFTVVKYLYSGVLDTTFGNGGIIQETALGIGKASAIKINSDGTIFVGGQITVNGVLLPTLIKYTSTGARLSTFGTNGVQTFSNFGTGTLNDLTIISIRTVAAAGQMGSVATIVEFGQSSDLLAQLNNGF